MANSASQGGLDLYNYREGLPRDLGLNEAGQEFSGGSSGSNLGTGPEYAYSVKGGDQANTGGSACRRRFMTRRFGAPVLCCSWCWG